MGSRVILRLFRLKILVLKLITKSNNFSIWKVHSCSFRQAVFQCTKFYVCSIFWFLAVQMCEKSTKILLCFFISKYPRNPNKFGPKSGIVIEFKIINAWINNTAHLWFFHDKKKSSKSIEAIEFWNFDVFTQYCEGIA